MIDSTEMETIIQPVTSASRAQLASNSKEGSLSNNQEAHTASASRKHLSTDNALTDIVFRSVSNASEGRAALLNFLSTSEEFQGVLDSNAELHCFVELFTTYIVQQIRANELLGLPLFPNLLLRALKGKIRPPKY